jgi:hypothetical protein
MSILPSSQQKCQLLGYDPHGATNLSTCHVLSPDQVRRAFGSGQVDFCFSIAEHVNMCWQMIIDVDDDAQTIGTQHGNHEVE